MALFEILALGDDLGPLNHLPHIAGGNFGVLGSIINHGPEILIDCD
jgi:hypothetical protein